MRGLTLPFIPMTRPENLGLGYRSNLARAFDQLCGRTKNMNDSDDTRNNGDVDGEQFLNPPEYRTATTSDIRSTAHDVALGRRLENVAERLNGDARPLTLDEEEMYEWERKTKERSKPLKIA